MDTILFFFFFLNYNVIEGEASTDFAELSKHTLSTKILQVACSVTDREGCILGKTKPRNRWFQQGDSMNGATGDPNVWGCVGFKRRWHSVGGLINTSLQKT